MRLTRPATFAAGLLAGTTFALAAMAMPAAPESDLAGSAEIWSLFSNLSGAVRELAAHPIESARATPTDSILLGIAGALLLMLAAGRLVPGRGELMVHLDYPPELQGTFRVRVSKRRHRRSDPPAEIGELLTGGRSSRTDHHLVSRETRFQRLRPRRYSVTIEGVLQDASGGTLETLCEIREERSVEVQRSSTARVLVECHSGECPVDVDVSWAGQPAKGVVVAARGVPQSIRYTRGGSAVLLLPKGSHTIAVGCGDRVIEHTVDVSSFRGSALRVDLSAPETVVFKGCPPAVEPYLHGDTAAAARALDREGQADTARLLLARLFREQGNLEGAASHFEAAGQPLKAAALRAKLSDFERAGELFEAGGEVRRAAEMYRAADQPQRAGDAFAAEGDLDAALTCYRGAGAISKCVDVLEEQGELFDAAVLALEHDEKARAVRLLQRVPPGDENFAAACARLSETFESEGHREMAAQKLEELLTDSGPRGAPPDLLWRLAELHDQNAEYDRARELLESLRQIEPTYPNVATKIESLEKKQSQQELTQTFGPTTSRGVAMKGFPGDDRYEIVEEIGRGGMGVVYRARDRRLDRWVALKRLSDSLGENPRAVQLFIHEARASARLAHPNITTLYDADQVGGVFFITMELLSGQPLSRILKRRERIAPRDVARLGIQIASGLHYAHQQRIVHRDIKTGNLFFTVDKRVKIMDFGLAKLLEEVRRGTTVIGGTPFYMAPEQAVGGPVDHRADIYALGATLFELSTGQAPFTEGDIAYHHRHTPAPDPRDIIPDMPDELAELMLEMLKKDVRARCESAAVVGRRLQRLLRA